MCCGIGLSRSSVPFRHMRSITSLSLCNASNSDCNGNAHGCGHTYDIPTTVSLRKIHHHTSIPSKLCKDASTALQLSGLKTGDTIAVGGFGLGGIPETLLNTLSAWDSGPTNLTVASLTAG